MAPLSRAFWRSINCCPVVVVELLTVVFDLPPGQQHPLTITPARTATSITQNHDLFIVNPPCIKPQMNRTIVRNQQSAFRLRRCLGCVKNRLARQILMMTALAAICDTSALSLFIVAEESTCAKGSAIYHCGSRVLLSRSLIRRPCNERQ